MRFDLKTDWKKYKIKSSGKDVIPPKDINGELFFLRKKLTAFCIISGFFVLYFLSSEITGFKNPFPVLKIPQGFIWLFKNFLPSRETFKYFPLILKTLVSAALTSAAATTAAGLCAFAAAIFGSNTAGMCKTFKIAVLLIGSFFRNVPLVVWSILLLFSFKQNEFTGFAALFLVTFGHLLRAFKEMIDETSCESFTALISAGVPYITAVSRSIIPSAAPSMVSWLLYAIETNIRDAALIGILTGTGIGFLFNLYFRSFRYNAAGMIILVLVIMVITVDIASSKIRKVLL